MPPLKNERHVFQAEERRYEEEHSSSNSSSPLAGSSNEEEISDGEADELLQNHSAKRNVRLLVRIFPSYCASGSARHLRQLNFHHYKHYPQKNRSVRGLVRLVLCSLLISMVFLTLVYLPLYASVGTRQVPHRDWTYNTSRNLADYVLPDNKTTILEPQHICEDKLFLLIVVCSAINNFAQRQTIRDTWGNTAEFNYGSFSSMHSSLHDQYLQPPQERLNYYNEFLHMNKNQTTIPPVLPVRVLFLVGRNREYDDIDVEQGEGKMSEYSILSLRLHNESLKHNDLIQEDFIDSYSNLTVKTVFALKWVSERCLQQVAFLMKCDDDTFVNVPNLLHFLLGGTVPIYNDTFGLYDIQTYQTLLPDNQLNRTRNYLTGFAFCAARPVTNVTSKWYMPYYMYPKAKYPKYLSGSAYLMSLDVVPRLYEAALQTPILYLEDVYITGMCAHRAKLQRVHQPLFGYLHSEDWCTYKGILTQHYMVDGSVMTEAYNFVTNAQNQCPPPWPYFRHIRLRKHNDRDCT